MRMGCNTCFVLIIFTYWVFLIPRAHYTIPTLSPAHLRVKMIVMQISTLVGQALWSTCK